MKIVNVVCAPGRTGFFFDDQKAIKSGAVSDGAAYFGDTMTPGFKSIRQAGESISVMLVLEDGQVAWGPAKCNAGIMLPARDNGGAVRILEVGNLPFTDDLKKFHKEKLAERGKAENREVSFQMVIDDVYAISKGRLVGRPRY